MQTYKISKSIEYIPLDENEQVLHDTETGDIHYLDEISGIILEQLKTPLTADILIEKLLEMFEGNPDEIRADTMEFLGELVEKKIVLVTEE